jgi:hypothetical protein
MVRLADYVRHERGLPPPVDGPPGRFPRDYGRPLVLGLGMVVLTAWGWSWERRLHGTRADVPVTTAALSFGWLPLRWIRSRTTFRVIAVGFAVVGAVLAFVAWLGWYGLLPPLPALLSAWHREPPRRPRGVTARVIGIALAICASGTGVAAMGFPTEGAVVTICYRPGAEHRPENDTIFGEHTERGLETLPGIETILGQDVVLFEPFTPDEHIDAVLTRARAHPNVLSAHRGDAPC